MICFQVGETNKTERIYKYSLLFTDHIAHNLISPHGLRYPCLG